ncbi:DUF4158 domain-containing protein [Rhizobium mongolense]|uniref:DUF4158 domain-containing protein n=1 Tax=Rhizobium mongolense TaxID=57676 RepID=A0ABR6IXP0_9HYPH|nr:hypothetical protein [Rhizobium mongolense]MBB4232692.1 hypothetical protein [Rhizobium mongolense]
MSLSHEDLVSRWSLSFSDMEFVTGKPVSARLGLAAQLKFFMGYGFFVPDRSAIPADVSHTWPSSLDLMTIP